MKVGIRWSKIKDMKYYRPWDWWMARNIMMVLCLPLFPIHYWQFLFVVFSYWNYQRMWKHEGVYEKEKLDNHCIRCGNGIEGTPKQSWTLEEVGIKK